MQFPRLGVLAGLGFALLLAVVLPRAARSTTLPLKEPAAAKKAPQFTAGNAPGTQAPVYNQQRTGSTDPRTVAARHTPTLAAPQPLPSTGKVKAAKPANPSANAPRALDPSSQPAARRDERVVPAAHPEWIDDPTQYDDAAMPHEMLEDGGCATCGPAGCGPAACGGLRDCVPCNYFAQNGWYLGGDYINGRVNFSDPGAILVRDVANGGLDFHDRVVPYETGYQSTFRVNAGYRWGACGESINFSYFNFNDNAVVNSPVAANNVVVAGPFALNCLPGEHLRTGLDIEANVYDLDYAKRIPICTSNGDPCDCEGGCCPPWAITWSAGARAGRLDLNTPVQLFNVNGGVAADGLSEVSFVGAGPKIGLEGRRYMGEMQRWSAFGKGSLSLLLGQFDVEQRLTTVGAPNTFSRQSYNYTRIVPMIDLEVGISRQLGKKTLFTAGYFMQVWIDASTVNNLNQPGVGILGPANMDDANMTMFDGFMLRFERMF